MKKMYVVLISTRIGEERTSNGIIGVFDNKKVAGSALDDAFCVACDNLEVDELNYYSHYNECEDFHIEDDDFLSYSDGKIVEVNLNEINLEHYANTH